MGTTLLFWVSCEPLIYMRDKTNIRHLNEKRNTESKVVSPPPLQPPVMINNKQMKIIDSFNCCLFNTFQYPQSILRLSVYF